MSVFRFNARAAGSRGLKGGDFRSSGGSNRVRNWHFRDAHFVVGILCSRVSFTLSDNVKGMWWIGSRKHSIAREAYRSVSKFSVESVLGVFLDVQEEAVFLGEQSLVRLRV